jgi:hypothetical protein
MYENRNNFLFLKSNSLFDTASKEPKNPNSQSRMWIVGSKIVQITTGLFSNICTEEPLLSTSRKPQSRLNSNTNKENPNSTAPIKISNENTNQTKLSQPTQAIDIPTTSSSCTTSNASAVTSTITNDSLASSGGSSVSIGNNNANNSFSSTSVHSSYQQGSQIQTVGSLINHDPENKSQEKTVVGSLSNKTDLDSFDERLDKAIGKDASQKNQVELLDDEKPAVVQRRASENPALLYQHHTRSIKRRYKSGLPLTTDRGDDDTIEEAYLKQYNAHVNSKHSKDDMGLF